MDGRPVGTWHYRLAETPPHHKSAFDHVFYVSANTPYKGLVNVKEPPREKQSLRKNSFTLVPKSL